MKNRVIFHIDMDAFFASIEQRDIPAYKGKPVIVGAKPGNRGVVSAASYEARSFGVHSAMPVSEAFRRCPEGKFVTPRMDVYIHESRKIMQIFKNFSPEIEQISVDEAFLDMTGTNKLFGTPMEAARSIKNLIHKERNLSASIGIAPNKFLAKIGSDLNKPDGITCTPFERDEIEKWLSPLEVKRIWGVGKKSNAVFERMGIKTIGDLQQLTLHFLHRKFGAQGVTLFNLCRGIDNREIENSTSVKSISREYTFNIDSFNRDEWKRTLFILSQDVARKARYKKVKGKTVVLTYRKTDFSRHSRRKTLTQPTNIAKLIYESAVSLSCQIKESSIRLIGVGITGLDEETQIDLFGEQPKTKDWEVSEQTVDKIVSKFGKDIILKGPQITNRKKTDSLIKERLKKRNSV